MLKETAKELKTRKPDKKSPFRCKVVLAGSENDDPEFTKLTIVPSALYSLARSARRCLRSRMISCGMKRGQLLVSR